MVTKTTRARFETQVPEELQVDPGSVMTEELKARHPELPLPVFSTKALEHGRNAAGASAIREGFSWNPQMDLLWALGYPHVVLIADGLPEGESRQSMIDHWEGGKRGGWIRSSGRANSLVIPRRGAYALLHKIQNPDGDPFKLDDASFRSITEPVELDPQKTANLLKLLDSQELLPRASLVIEALVGPSAVLEVLCGIAEDPEFDSRDSAFRSRAVSAAQPLLRRVPEADAEALKRRLLAMDQKRIGTFVDLVTDPVTYTQGCLNEGNFSSALFSLPWVDGHYDLVARTYDQCDEFPDVPSPRLMFVGGAALIEREALNASKYDSRDVSEAYVYHYTTIRSQLLLPTVLRFLLDPVGPYEPYPDRPITPQAVNAWFEAHAEPLASWLLNTRWSGEDETLAKKALALTGKN